ncbi:type III secretion system export apparatus subunit SctV [Trinickia caryophylli]|uniref:Type III secretion protein V n=1 Tax=Trinickia caryophylli TaxID=28094 RepID=A0A1X7D6A4_TRICW|nr:type III secretion system export apparatus subunit SctV [Trinickia caryophylli]PMS12684.1 EscV/YscV/HrcV family type III secretion system export apparatus protein [Trinickia caryophylli]TRX15090.1 EscV/YscV/HrcV family type III secretion system export apparatus protein [Trinickia caryophylli]WQE14949.1 type III secretion system export apparatus subunit SctV [Trinickia caryophylli]SMF09687.1 type III secretion protein V [Trinickia caryophylli]GLU31322.1 EscV/YscV/HrcV family type III secreti
MIKSAPISQYSGEVAIAGVIVAVIALMILPLPTFLIDTLLGINITTSVVLLMVTMYIPKATSLSAFPSLLLFTTLFRLSLNIASTKSILLNADAGHIIESFGELVVGGNLVVGLVVFLIITTVQFIVIAKGSERVAEVGARFTLDGMPGKQMSIDADVRAGNLTAEQAQKRRARLAMESQLHGGMDGAMKFVKGDAIAGLVITMVNILAGIVIGVTYHGMSAGEAANRFSVLSIGDAMVSQIPSLLISVAAGVLITRVADEEKEPRSLGTEIIEQLSGNARALFSAAALLCGFALVPGFPSALFVVLAGGLFAGGMALRRTQRKKDEPSGPELPALSREGSKERVPTIATKPPAFAVPLAIRLAPALAAGIDAEALDAAFERGRRALTADLGLPFPRTALWISDELSGHAYQLFVQDVPSDPLDLAPGIAVLREVPDALAAQCEKRANVAGLDVSYWIDAAKVPDAAKASIVSREALIAGHAVTRLAADAKLFIGLQETQWLLERAGTEYPGLVAEVQKAMPAQRIAEVLRRMLEEHVPIRNMRAILESLVVWGPKEKDLLMVTEYVRGDLGRFIAHRATGGTGELPSIVLDPEVEQAIRQAIKPTPAGNFLALEPTLIDTLLGNLEGICGSDPAKHLAVVCAMDIRRYTRRMIEQRFPSLPVYSFQELGSDAHLSPVGRLAF